MSKVKVEVEVEVPEDMNKFEKYALARGALNQAASQIAEENSHGDISFSTSSGSWKLEEVSDE